MRKNVTLKLSTISAYIRTGLSFLSFVCQEPSLLVRASERSCDRSTEFANAPRFFELQGPNERLSFLARSIARFVTPRQFEPSLWHVPRFRPRERLEHAFRDRYMLCFEQIEPRKQNGRGDVGRCVFERFDQRTSSDVNLARSFVQRCKLDPDVGVVGVESFGLLNRASGVVESTGSAVRSGRHEPQIGQHLACSWVRSCPTAWCRIRLLATTTTNSVAVVHARLFWVFGCSSSGD